ncbi:MAG: ADOP family duplicated permease [Vicinamibacteraceae bacterium]
MADWRQVVRERLAELRLTTAAESGLAEEVAQHLEDLHRDLQNGGASPGEAYTRTVSELDDINEIRSGLARSQRMPKHDVVPLGDATSHTRIGDLQRDLRYAGRTMRTNPVFVVFVVVTLGLGIGANTTVFTVINTLLLNPMPVAAPSELVAVSSVPSVGTAQGNALMPLSYPNFKDYQAQTSVFDSLAGYARMRALSWQADGATQGLMSEFVTGNYFSTLGVGVAAGRTFGPEADMRDGADAVAVMNYGTWQTRFGGAPDIVGRQLRLNGQVVTVIGVARPGFIGVNGLVGPDLWLPFATAEQLLPSEMRTAVTDRSKPMLQGVGRLTPGATVSRTEANVTTVASVLARQYPAANEGQTVTVRPISDVLFGGGSRIVRFAGAVLAAVAGIVLLIACSNVANLMLARSAARQGDMAVRMALGASRGRLVRQLLTESLLYGVLSGGFGVLLALSGVQLLATTLPATGIFVASRLDTTVLLFALFISVVTGVLSGALPALTASRAGVAGILNEARTAGRSARRVSVANTLLVGQVALSFLLLVTASLFLRSIQRAYDIDPGFNAARLAVFITNPGQAGYGEPNTRAFYQMVRDRVARLRGVESVSWASNMPLFARPVTGLQIEGRPEESSTERVASILNTVDDGYFQTSGVSIQKGREFTELDHATSLPVAVVNEKLARDYWPGEDALGKRIRVPGEQQMREIVGVARTANYSSWGEPSQLCVYIPLAQNHLPAMTLYVRTQGNPAQIIGPVVREISAADSQVLVNGIRTGQQVTDGSLFQARIGVVLLSVFGLIALGLASIGLYGILAYAVTQRQREIGLRMALGASHSTVMQLILKQGMTLVSIGVAIGFVAALLVGRVLSGMLYGVGATDPVSLIAAASVLGGVALVACYVPARWATRVDPLVALRQA